MRHELRTGRRHGQHAYALASRVVQLVHMAPDHDTYAGVAVGYAKKLFGILQRHGIDPAAAHRHGVVVQGNEHVALASAGKRCVEAREFRAAEAPMRLARHAAVEHHDPPVAQVMSTAHMEGWRGQLATHGVHVIVIARKAPHGLAGCAQQFPHRGVAGRIVVDQVAGHQDCGGMRDLTLRLAQYRLKSGARHNAAQGTRGTAEQVRIGNLQQADLGVHPVMLPGANAPPSDLPLI